MFGLAHPLALLLLPLALLPLARPSGRSLPYSSLALLPPDRASSVIDTALRAAAALAVAAIVVGLAGPYRPEYEVERVGQGAEIVLLLDRSRSMDQSFGRAAGPAPRGKVRDPASIAGVALSVQRETVVAWDAATGAALAARQAQAQRRSAGALLRGHFTQHEGRAVVRQRGDGPEQGTAALHLHDGRAGGHDHRLRQSHRPKPQS